MRLGNLDLNLLVVFEALAQTKSVSATAARIGRSQSATSGALARLRDYFNDELLVSVGNRMVLTERGEALVEPVQDALMLIRARVAAPGSFDPSTSQRRFRIVASDYLLCVLLADLVRSMSASAPGISFDISHPDEAARERLHRGELDIFITVEALMPPGVTSERLFEDEHAVVCWDQNPACLGDLDATTFFALKHVVVVFGPHRSQSYSESLLAGSVERDIGVKVASFAEIPIAVIGTPFIATMYRRHAEYFAQTMPLKIMPMPIVMPNIHESVGWHPMRGHDPGVRFLIDKLHDLASKLPPPGAAERA